MGQDKLAQGGVHGEPIHVSAPHRDDQLGRGSIHGEAGGEKLAAGHQEVFLLHLLPRPNASIGQLENAKDGADTHTRIQVGTPVNGVADDGISCVGMFVKEDGLFLFLAHDHAAAARAAHGSNEDVIPNHVQLFLFITGRVGGASEAGKIGEAGPADPVGDRLEGELECVEEKTTAGRSAKRTRLRESFILFT